MIHILWMDQGSEEENLKIWEKGLKICEQWKQNWNWIVMKGMKDKWNGYVIWENGYQSNPIGFDSVAN